MHVAEPVGAQPVEDVVQTLRATLVDDGRLVTQEAAARAHDPSGCSIHAVRVTPRLASEQVAERSIAQKTRKSKESFRTIPWLRVNAKTSRNHGKLIPDKIHQNATPPLLRSRPGRGVAAAASQATGRTPP